jgi:hypothetical protein
MRMVRFAKLVSSSIQLDNIEGRERKEDEEKCLNQLIQNSNLCMRMK